MAPPVAVLGKDQVRQRPDCPLKQLVQYECELVNHEVVCTPFKRLFQACTNSGSLRLIEVTNHDTNS